jgi:hypothetical protein
MIIRPPAASVSPMLCNRYPAESSTANTAPEAAS